MVGLLWEVTGMEEGGTGLGGSLMEKVTLELKFER